MDEPRSRSYRVCRRCRETLTVEHFGTDRQICDTCLDSAVAESVEELDRAVGSEVPAAAASPDRGSQPAAVDRDLADHPSSDTHDPHPPEPEADPAPRATTFSPEANAMSDTSPIRGHDEAEHLAKELENQGWETAAKGWYHPELTRELGVVTFDAALLIQIRGAADANKVAPRTCEEIDS